MYIRLLSHCTSNFEKQTPCDFGSARVIFMHEKQLRQVMALQVGYM